MVVADVVFDTNDSPFKDAKQRECQILDGLGVLVNQAVIGLRSGLG